MSSSSSTSTTRNMGMDIAKVFAMFQVVYIHFAFYTNGFSNTCLSRAVTSLTVSCVPLFIAVNGAILFNRPFNSEKHWLRIRRYLFLLFVWRAIDIAVYRFLGAPRLSVSETFALWVSGDADGYLLGHFWFLYALIGLYLLFPLLKLAWDENREALYPLCLGLLSLFCLLDGARSLMLIVSPTLYVKLAPFFNSFSALNPLSAVGYLCLYFVGGAFISDRVASIKQGKTDGKGGPGLRIIVVAILVSSILTCLIHEAQYRNGSGAFGVDYGYWLPTTFLLTLSLFTLLLQIDFRGEKRRAVFGSAVAALGSGTFAVYMLHMPALVVFAKLESGYLCTQFSGNALFLAQTATALLLYALLLFIGLLLKKIPFIGSLF